VRDVVVDLVGRQVLLEGRPIRFTRREFDLLLFLACHPGAAFTRPQLLRAVWGHEFSGERTVDVHVRRLRMKLGALGDAVATVHGFGYRLDHASRFTVVHDAR
jgi:two-component system OmpR family response regulator